MNDKHNYTNKKISEFNENDTVYMQKTKSGFTHTFLIKFKSFSKGHITGEILDIQPNNQKSIWLNQKYFVIGDELSGRISKCYTFKADSGCRWFIKVFDNWLCI